MDSIDEIQNEFWNMLLDGFSEEELTGYVRFREKLLLNIDRAMEGKKDYEK